MIIQQGRQRRNGATLALVPNHLDYTDAIEDTETDQTNLLVNGSLFFMDIFLPIDPEASRYQFHFGYTSPTTQYFYHAEELEVSFRPTVIAEWFKLFLYIDYEIELFKERVDNWAWGIITLSEERTTEYKADSSPALSLESTGRRFSFRATRQEKNESGEIIYTSGIPDIFNNGSIVPLDEDIRTGFKYEIHSFIITMTMKKGFSITRDIIELAPPWGIYGYTFTRTFSNYIDKQVYFFETSYASEKPVKNIQNLLELCGIDHKFITLEEETCILVAEYKLTNRRNGLILQLSPGEELGVIIRSNLDPEAVDSPVANVDSIRINVDTTYFQTSDELVEETETE